MDTYKELTNQRLGRTGRAIYYEYVSKYRRVLVLNDGCSWVLRVEYKGITNTVKPWEKTFGDKAIAYGWAQIAVINREIIVGCLTIKEAAGRVIIDRLTDEG